MTFFQIAAIECCVPKQTGVCSTNFDDCYNELCFWGLHGEECLSLDITQLCSAKCLACQDGWCVCQAFMVGSTIGASLSGPDKPMATGGAQLTQQQLLECKWTRKVVAPALGDQTVRQGPPMRRSSAL